MPAETTADCTGECQAGYYCPAGSTNQRANQCGADNFYCPAGSANKRSVSTGHYTTGGGSNTRTGEAECDAGTYCVGGVRKNCPAGKYQEMKGQGFCKSCAGGKYSGAGLSLIHI